MEAPRRPDPGKSGCQNRTQNVRIVLSKIKGLIGRGSWIRTNDLQYPKPYLKTKAELS